MSKVNLSIRVSQVDDDTFISEAYCTIDGEKWSKTTSGEDLTELLADVAEWALEDE